MTDKRQRSWLSGELSNNTMYKVGDKIDFLEFPTILWDKKYETDEKCFKMLIQHISDYMLYQRGTLFDNTTSHNKKVNYDIFNGNMKSKEVREMYWDVTHTFGEEGSATMKDYNFFHTDFQSIEGLLIKMPFEIKAHNISQAFVDKKIVDNSRMGAAMIRNQVSDYLTQNEGQDFSGMKNEEIYVPSTLEELLAQMNAPQQEEYVITRLIKNLKYRHRIDDVLRKTNSDKFIVNAQFCYIEYQGQEPFPKYVHPSEISWISPTLVEDMDDENISAWSVNKWISLENALRKYNHELATSEGIDGLRDIVKKLRQGNYFGFTYNPFRYQQDREYLSEDNSNEIPNNAGWINWQPYFYNILGQSIYGNNCAILEQKGWFKVIKNLKFKVLVDGKNPTKEQISKIKSNVNDYNLKYVPVDDDYKRKESEYVINAPKEELWEYTRLGHNVIINVRKYRFQTRYEKEINRVFPPVVGRISYDKSFVTIGETFARKYNSIMYKVDEILNLAGADEILIVDKQQRTMPLKQFLHAAKKAAIIEVDSTIVQDKSNAAATQHLQKISLTPSIETVLKYLEAANVFKQTYDNMVGLNQQRLGQASPYEGVGQVNALIQQAGYITQKYFHEDYLFRKNFYQRYADIIKQIYADGDRYLSVWWGKGEKEILRTTKELSLYDYEMYLDVGIDALNDKQYIMTIAEKAVSAGSLTYKEMIDIYFGENAQESIAILNNGLDELERAKLQIQQQAQQIQQQTNEINRLAKVDVPLQVAQMQVAQDKYETDMRYQDKRESANEKGDLADIKNQQDLEKEGLQYVADEQSKNRDVRRQGQLKLFESAIGGNKSSQ